MRLFVLDGEFDALRDLVISTGASEKLSFCYSVYGAFLYVLAPLLTAGFVLTFIKNVQAYFSYAFNTRKQICYFTELNTKSIILATDVFKTVGKKALIVFTNVDFNSVDDDLLEQARIINAICFTGKEITEISLKANKKDVVRKIYFISENQEKNVENALTLINKYRTHAVISSKNTQFYVFSVSEESAILLDNADNSEIKLRRVDESRNLIYEILRGDTLFTKAYEENGVKKINALILGSGKHGTELLKALCWYGQMAGYEIEIHVVDKEVGVQNKFYGACPEIEKFNGKRIDGDAYVNITFHEGVDVESSTFRKLVTTFGKLTVVFAMLGNDDLNIRASIIIREEYGRVLSANENDKPIINATVESPEKSSIINVNGGLKNYTGASYDINILGDINNQYSLAVIEQQELENKGLKCHLRWSQTGEDIINDTKKFDNYEYFRRASVAEALYSETRIKLGLLINDDIDDEELLKEYEHRRWNAYMRTEGYVYGKTKNAVYKTHPSLIPYERLSKKEKDKDKVVLEASEQDV
jgi:hypothetical protein